MIDFLNPYQSWTFPNFLLPKLLKNWSVIRIARQLAHDPALVAGKMIFLNRFTKGSLQAVSWEIYHLKRQLTWYFYHHYPTDVAQEEQRLHCRSCGGTGKHISYYWESGDIRNIDICWHCNGTGTYKKVQLMGFTFHIDGKCFGWHQPRDLVEFDVYEPLLIGKYKGEKSSEWLKTDDDDTLLAYLTIHEFLWRKGLALHRYGIGWALKQDIKRLRWYAPRIMRLWWKHFVNELIWDQQHPNHPDYIPF